MKLIFALLVAFAATACSNQQLYDAAQHNHEQKCLKQPPAMYQACMAEFDKSYQEYEKERQEVLTTQGKQ